MNKNRVITREAYVRSVTDEMIEKRQAEFVISSEAVDTYRTVFKRSGWDLTRYLNNNVVCYQHRANSGDPDDVIGIGEVFFEGDNMIGRVTFEDAETNPKAEKIMRKVHNGTLKMASINAMPSEYRYGNKAENEDPEILYFTRQELMEWSIVTVGSNPDALKRNAAVVEDIKKETSEVKEEVEKTEQRKLSVYEAQVLINKNNS